MFLMFRASVGLLPLVQLQALSVVMHTRLTLRPPQLRGPDPSSHTHTFPPRAVTGARAIQDLGAALGAAAGSSPLRPRAHSLSPPRPLPNHWTQG